jgi:hypothetical protein
LEVSLGEYLRSHKILAAKNPIRITKIVRPLYTGGSTKGVGLKSRKMACKKKPATTAAKLKVRVAVLI